jgi:cytochrome c oxidase subunit 4
MTHASERVYYVVFGLLLVLLFATVAATWRDFGEWNFVIAAAIASAKAALIMLFFMHVKDGKPLIWVAASASFFWLAILFGITFSDYLTR